MKKFLLTAIAIVGVVLAFSGCSKDYEPSNKPTLAGTKWTADDDVTAIIYGKGCTTTIEFLTNDECQRIDVRPSIFGGSKSTEVTKGTYTYENKTVIWKIGDRTVKGTVSGSIITTEEGINRRVYTKE